MGICRFIKEILTFCNRHKSVWPSHSVQKYRLDALESGRVSIIKREQYFGR